MKENKFYQNRKEIQKIGRERNVDVGVATDIYINENNLTKQCEDYVLWIKMINHYQNDRFKTLADLFK